jgi:glycosyltransferase involved in cell wall biosynthesis
VIHEAQSRISVVVPSYRDPLRTISLANLLTRQRLPDPWLLETLVVDDGSGPETVEALRAGLPNDVRLLVQPRNLGRASARQKGVEAAKGSVLAFLDADCEPIDKHLLASHLAALLAGSIASVGPIEGDGHGFWHRYQVEVSARRAVAHSRGERGVGSTANLMVDANALREAGGFCTAFMHYGFEDTDLLLRLSEQGAIAWTNAAVRHLDTLSMLSVATRMREAGRHGASRMRLLHPGDYARSRFGRCDASLHPWLRQLGKVAAPLLMPAVRAMDMAIASRLLPWQLARPLVTALSGLSFVTGTCDSLKSGSSVPASRNDR